MDKFRVFDQETETMLYDGFVLDNQGLLFQINSNGLIRADKNRYLIMHGLDRKDVSGTEVYVGDVLLYEAGSEFVVAFGEHDSFCPGDRIPEPSHGFVAALVKCCSPDYEDIYPLSWLEEISKVIGYCIDDEITYLSE